MLYCKVLIVSCCIIFAALIFCSMHFAMSARIDGGSGVILISSSTSCPTQPEPGPSSSSHFPLALSPPPSRTTWKLLRRLLCVCLWCLTPIMSSSAVSPAPAVAAETTPLLTVARQRYTIHSASEASSSSEYTPTSDLVDITKDRYDLTTFKGRLLHFASVTSPLTLLASNAELRGAQELVSSYEAKFPSNRVTGTYLVPRSEALKYWKAKQLVDSSVHPDTGEVILLPFRMAAFVPTNLLVVGGMLMPNPSLAGIVFWQWINQSLNVAVNYSNANKSVPMNMKEVGLAYAAATTSAVGIAVGMSRGVPKLRVSPGVKGVLTSLVPFVSVASAGIVNISCMRWKEIKDGVGIFIRDAEGNRHKIGDSSIAGQRAVAMTAASRVLTNIPTLILPPLALKFLQKAKLIPASGALTRAVDLTLIGTSLLVFLPPAIATFPQVASVSPKALEPKFHHLQDQNGQPIDKVEFNKGL